MVTPRSKTYNVPSGQGLGTGRFAAGGGTSGSMVIAAAISAFLASLSVAGAAPPPPPPAPAVGTGSEAVFSLSSTAGATNEAFSLGMALAKGQFPSTYGILATGTGLASHQVDIRATWADGSAKFAVISGRASITAGARQTIKLRQGTASTGAALTEADLLSSGVEATLQFAGGPVMTLSALISQAAVSNSTGLTTNGRVRQVIAGPQMSRWLYAARLSSTNAHVIGWMQVSFYGSGKAHIIMWVENGFTRIAGCAGQAGVLTAAVNGVTVFNQADVHLALHGRVSAQNAEGIGHWTGTAPDLYAAPDPGYLQTTKIVPAYFADTTSSATLSTLSQSYSPSAYGQLTTSPRDSGGNGLNNGDFDAGMASAGYHFGIGLLPGWDAYYLTSNGDKRAWNAVVANAIGYGRYGVHQRDELTMLPVNPIDVPNKTLPQGSPYRIADVGANQFPTTEVLPACTAYDPTGLNLSPEYWAQTHHPSAGFLAYLLTGHEFFLELSQFVAGTCFLRQNNIHRDYANGYQRGYHETTRGAAWGLRSIFQAAAISTDGTALKAGFSTIASNNVADYKAKYLTTNMGGFGVPRPYSNFQAGSGLYRVNAWELDFSVAAWGYGLHLEPVSGSSLTDMAAYFQWHGKWPVARLGPLGDASAFGFNCAGRENSIAIAPVPTGQPETYCWDNNTGWFADPGAMFLATLGASNATNNTNTIGAFDANNGYFPDATSYYGNLMLPIMYAVEHGVPGALAGYQRLTGASNWPAFEANAALNPGYGHRPRTVFQWGMGSAAGSLVGDVWTPGKDAQGRINKASWATVPTNRWIEVSGTRIDQQLTSKIVAENLGWNSATLWGTTGANSIFQSWSGMALDAALCRLWFLGGGHSDGYNNGLYRFDANTMNWVIECLPSNRTLMSSAYLNNGSSSFDPDSSALGTANFNLNNPPGTIVGTVVPFINGPFWDEVYTDNTKPTARHTYEGMEFAAEIGNAGSVIMHAKRLWMFDLASGRWNLKRLTMDQAVTLNSPAPNSTQVTMISAVEAGYATWDEVNKKILVSSSGSSAPAVGGGAYQFDWTTQSWSLWSGAYGLNYNDAAHDRVGRTIVSFKPPVSDQTVYQGNYWNYNMDAPGITGGTVQLAGGLSLSNFVSGGAFYDGAAMAYVPSLNRHWVCTRSSAGGMMWCQLDPTTTPWTLSPLTFANAQPITERLILGRIKYLPALNALMVWDHCFANAFVFKF